MNLVYRMYSINPCHIIFYTRPQNQNITYQMELMKEFLQIKYEIGEYHYILHPYNMVFVGYVSTYILSIGGCIIQKEEIFKKNLLALHNGRTWCIFLLPHENKIASFRFIKSEYEARVSKITYITWVLVYLL